MLEPRPPEGAAAGPEPRMRGDDVPGNAPVAGPLHADEALEGPLAAELGERRDEGAEQPHKKNEGER